MRPVHALPRHRGTALLSLVLLHLGGGAQAQGPSPTLLPLGIATAILAGNSAALFSLAAAFPPAPRQTGRCRPLTGGGALSATNPPVVAGLVPGEPCTCELEFTRGAQDYLGAAAPSGTSLLLLAPLTLLAAFAARRKPWA